MNGGAHLLVEALLRVVRILVRGEEAEFEVDQEVEEPFWWELWDNNAELDMATPPHLQSIKISIIPANEKVTFALHLFLETGNAFEARGSGSLDFQQGLQASQK